MIHIIEEIICSENSDISRFIAFFEAKIAEGKLQRTKRFESTKGRIKLNADEKAEAKEEKNRLKAQK